VRFQVARRVVRLKCHEREILKLIRNQIGVSILGCLILLPSLLHPQNAPDSALTGKAVVEIQIFGNEKTRTSVILREMQTKTGDPFDSAIVEGDRKRVQSLGIFNRVETFVDPAKGGVRIVVLVTEGLTVLPYPILQINDRDWKKLSYGAGVRFLNFRGRAETLDVLFKAGYNPIVRTAYVNPWFGGNRRLQAAAEAYYQRALSKHFVNEKVSENRLALSFQIGKRFTLFTSVFALFGFRQVSFSPNRIDSVLHPRDRFPVFGVSFAWDCRDLREYPKKGFLLSASVRNVGWPSLRVEYRVLDADARGYLPLGRLFTLALRNAATLTAGEVPVYDKLYLGYEERVRGHWHETAEGGNRWIAGAALRFPLIPVRYFDLGEESEMMNLKFGISLGLFADAGSVWNRGGSMRPEKILFGYGAGLHFHLPVADVLRLDAAFNERGRVEWILDLGVDI
jgi:outer membrane protein assembly factor BamA